MSVFCLANALRHTSYADVAEWVRAANARNSFLAAAIDHLPVAEFLLQRGLVRSGSEIAQSSQLMPLSRMADRATLLAIAWLLLQVAPPEWLPIAVRGGLVRGEFIPEADPKASIGSNPSSTTCSWTLHGRRSPANKTLSPSDWVSPPSWPW
jgi:hypothetical protein